MERKMSNLIGQSLGRYHILEQLGEGGMATVYKAYDTRLERDVALKIIRKSVFSAEVMERMLKRFEREAKALAKLNHPNIVSIIDYGEYEGSPYLVMPYYPSGTLKQRLGKPIPWREAVRLLLPIARALLFVHEQSIIHRDVKPSNILLTLSGEPMISDFGIAKILTSEEAATLTDTGVGVGTPEYMAPEQGRGQTSRQSDIYSLGVVLYELITGRKPYVADTPLAVLLKQATEPLPRPRQFAPDLPEKAEQVLLKALAKEPENRYQNMSELIKALEELLTIPSTSKREKGYGEKKLPKSKRRIPFAFMGLILGLGMIMFGVLVILGRQGNGLLSGLATNTHTPTSTSTLTPTNTITASRTPSRTPTRISSPTTDVCAALASDETNLLLNGGFEIGIKQPCSWKQDSFKPNQASLAWDNTTRHSGQYSVKIYLEEVNDSRWIQQVTLQPNSTYILSGWIKTQNVEKSIELSNMGANLSVFSSMYRYVYGQQGLLGTNDWKYFEITFRTDANEKYYYIAARLGYFAGQTTGTAWFDDLVLKPANR